jgi:hypothetical protein
MKERGKGIRVTGTSASSLFRKTRVPLTAIPEESKYNPVNIIALANELDPEPDADDPLLDSLCEMTEDFHSKLYLVRVAKSKLWEAYEILNRPFKLNRMLRTLHPV